MIYSFTVICCTRVVSFYRYLTPWFQINAIMRVKITQIDREKVNISVDKQVDQEEDAIHGFIDKKTIFAGHKKSSCDWHREFIKNCLRDSLNESILCDVHLVLMDGSIDVNR